MDNILSIKKKSKNIVYSVFYLLVDPGHVGSDTLFAKQSLSRVLALLLF